MTYRQYRVHLDGKLKVSTEDGKFVDVEPEEGE